MLTKVLNFMVCLCGVLHNAHGFWWGQTYPTTTPAPPQMVLKQIPLTYFRTYTYQPVQPYAAPYFAQGLNVGAGPGPTIGHLGRFDPFTGKFHYEAIGEAALMVKKPTTTTRQTTTTSTTTTTTPAPTTTTTSTTTTTPTPTTTTTSTTTTTPAPPTTTTTTPSNGITAPHHLITEYPTYNRRMYPSPYAAHYYRSSQYHHPYPEYSAAYQQPQSQQQQQQHRVPLAATTTKNTKNNVRSHVQYVPCMCPINVGGGVGLDDELPALAPIQQPAFLSRTTPDDDDDMELPEEQESVELEKSERDGHAHNKIRKIVIEKDIAEAAVKSTTETISKLANKFALDSESTEEDEEARRLKQQSEESDMEDEGAALLN